MSPAVRYADRWRLDPSARPSEWTASCRACRRLVVAIPAAGELMDTPLVWRFLTRSYFPAPPGQAIQGFGVTDGERHRCPGDAGGKGVSVPALGLSGVVPTQRGTLPPDASWAILGTLPAAGTEGGGE